MNEENYTSLPVVKRLVEAGIKLETEAYWCCQSYGGLEITPFLTTVQVGDKAVYFPAPSMPELLRSLPMDEHHYVCFYQTGGSWISPGDEAFFKGDNQCNCLADLLIWLKGKK